jgi:dTDP-4-dehydrorhamnose reductase
MRILVTGASGLVGINLALEAAQNGPGTTEGRGGAGAVVFGTAHRSTIRTDAFHVIQTDLLAPGELERVLDQTQPEWVINCAALAVIDACEADPELAYRMNVELPGKLAETVARGGARLVHLSTDAVFDGKRGDYTEADQPNPQGVYARTKLESERAVAQADPQAIIARVNLFGWSLSGKRSLAEFFFYNLQAGKQVMGFTDVIFCPLLVNDLAEILLKMLAAGLSGLYHVVSSECWSKYDFGVALAERFELDASLIRPSLLEESGLLAARSPNLSLRSDKLAAALGQKSPGIQPALDRFYSLYQQGYPQLLKRMASP